jgi:hypothetical protein
MPIDYDWIAAEMSRSAERARARRSMLAPEPISDDKHVTVAQLAPDLLVTVPSHRPYCRQRVLAVRVDGNEVTLRLLAPNSDGSGDVEETITLPADADAVVHDAAAPAIDNSVIFTPEQDRLPPNEPMAEADLVRDAAPTPLLGPPPIPNRLDHPYVGTIDFQGIPVWVETARGDVRSGTDPNGKPWSVVMPAHYGEVANTVGVDGDPVDVFVGDDASAPEVYVFHTRVAGTRKYDEDKAFLGFRTLNDARRAFFAAYTRGGMLESVTTWTVDQFKRAMSTRAVSENKLDREAQSGV